jgi:hypothetical protein
MSLLFLAALLQRTPEPLGVPTIASFSPQRQVAMSPSELKKEIEGVRSPASLSTLWQRLGIKPYEDEFSSLFDVSIRLGRRPDSDIAVVRLEMGQITRLFVFKRFDTAKEKSWRLTGCVVVFSLVVPPSFSLMETSRHQWLVVDAETDHGSQINSIATSWFELDSGSPKRILVFPSGSYEGPSWLMIGTERLMNSTLLSFATDQTFETLTFRFTNEFGDFEGKPLFNSSRAVAYSRPVGSSAEFQFDPELSKMSASDFVTLFDQGKGHLRKVFFKVYHDELKAIADSKDARRREWLRLVATPGPYERPSEGQAEILRSLNERKR